MCGIANDWVTAGSLVLHSYRTPALVTTLERVVVLACVGTRVFLERLNVQSGHRKCVLCLRAEQGLVLDTLHASGARLERLLLKR